MTIPSRENYRADIDGIRAIAVLSVIVFHIDSALLPGGFIGVDIFFVISGYLISLYIFRELERDRFSLIEFYRRRIKRIAPAMLIVVAATLILSQLIFRPEDAETTAESALWSLFSLANVYFWLHLDTTYFAAASNEKPLLHLWSLGVEEQFYIVWPLVLMLVYRAVSTRVFVVVSTLIATASFLLGELLFDRDPAFVFYMLPTRAGELLVGALAAQMVLRRPAQSFPTGVVTGSAIAGLILVLSSCIFLSEERTFPGLLAVPPTMGTAILILAGHYGDSWPTRLLKTPPMVWVGLISYSAYLLHWPLLAFFRYGNFEFGALAGSAIFVLTVFLAWLSYRFIESPSRLSARPAGEIFARQYFIPASALAIAAVVAMKIDGYGVRWMSADYKENLAALRDRTRPARHYNYVCQRQRVNAGDLLNKDCIVGAETGRPPTAILWGDSNAAHYVGLLGVLAREQGFRFRNVEIDSCPPILTNPAAVVSARRLADCRESLKIVESAIETYSVVLISASWTFYQSRSDNFLDAFFETARTLASQGKLVIIIGKAPVISTYDRLCWEKALSYPGMDCIAPSVPLGEDVASVNSRLRAFADSTPSVEYYEATRYLCPDGECSAFDKNGTPLYFDKSHLTLRASWNIGEEIIKREGVPAPFTLISP